MADWPDRILITGAHGFVGRHLVRQLQRQTAATLYAPRHAECDLRRPDAVRTLLNATRPQWVIHLAARVGGIGLNRARPADLFYDNLIMGAHLTHEAWRQGVEKLVTLGTVCAYPKHTPVPFQEADLWAGYPEETNAPYGIAKRALLVQGQAYRQQYGFKAIHLLPTNLYGPGDNFSPDSSHVIPALMQKIARALDTGEPVLVWGSGQASRDFLYVEDAAAGILAAARTYDAPEPLNLGSGREVTIRDLVRLLAEQAAYAGEVVWDTSKPDGQPRRQLDTRRARQILGWQATTPLEEGLRRTWLWYRQQEQRERAA